MAVLEFPSTSGFRKYEDHFVKDSVAHPAKANLLLLDWVISNYAKEGDLVLDPMAGTGSTGIVASILGRNAVLVELEEKFVGFIEANIAKSERQTVLGKRGWVRVVHGDARNLSNLLESADVVVTSPPYAEQNIDSRPFGGIKDTSANIRGEIGRNQGTRYDVDVVVTSPPYAETQIFQDKTFIVEGQMERTKYGYKRHQKARAVGEKDYWGTVLESSNNIGNLRYGSVDCVVTSPPYANRLADAAVHDGDKARMSYRQSVDCVVTSPPYSDSLTVEANKEAEMSRLQEKYVKGELSGRESIRIAQKGKFNPNTTIALDRQYSDSKENIGNLKGETYLEAMRTVYDGCREALKPDGKMVLILKNFIRNKKVVRLDLDTIKLCESVGFKLLERHQFKLPTESFWRIIYSQKHPEVEKIEFEDVLVFGALA